MFGALGNIGDMIKAARQLQGRMAEMQAKVAQARFSGESGGGKVRATVDGRGLLVDIKIDPFAVEDVELLEDLVKAAVGSASRTALEAMQAEMSQMTGGLPLPENMLKMLQGGG